MITKIKACKFCGETTHYPFQCRLNPKQSTKTPRRSKCQFCGSTTHYSYQCSLEHRSEAHIYKRPKGDSKWTRAKRAWFKAHPAEYFNCHYCGKLLSKKEIELDHYISRSRRPDLKYKLSNLVPSCRWCNQLKGSLSGDEFIAKRSAA